MKGGLMLLGFSMLSLVFLLLLSASAVTAKVETTTTKSNNNLAAEATLLKWNKTFPEERVSSSTNIIVPATHQELLVVAFNQSHTIVAFDAATGEVVWNVSSCQWGSSPTPIPAVDTIPTAMYLHGMNPVNYKAKTNHTEHLTVAVYCIHTPDRGISGGLNFLFAKDGALVKMGGGVNPPQHHKPIVTDDNKVAFFVTGESYTSIWAIYLHAWSTDANIYVFPQQFNTTTFFNNNKPDDTDISLIPQTPEQVKNNVHDIMVVAHGSGYGKIRAHLDESDNAEVLWANTDEASRGAHFKVSINPTNATLGVVGLKRKVSCGRGNSANDIIGVNLTTGVVLWNHTLGCPNGGLNEWQLKLDGTPQFPPGGGQVLLPVYGQQWGSVYSYYKSLHAYNGSIKVNQGAGYTTPVTFSPNDNGQYWMLGNYGSLNVYSKPDFKKLVMFGRLPNWFNTNTQVTIDEAPMYFPTCETLVAVAKTYNQGATLENGVTLGGLLVPLPPNTTTTSN